MLTEDSEFQPGAADTLPEWITPYISGLVDNHFNLLVTIGKDSNRKIGYRIQPQTRYKTEGKGIITILEKYCTSVGISPRIKEKEDTTYTHYEFMISSRTDLSTFIAPLQPYLIVRAEAIEILTDQILPALDEGAHRNKDTFLDLVADIETFRKKAGRANRSKYDLEYFEDEWET